VPWLSNGDSGSDDERKKKDKDLFDLSMLGTDAGNSDVDAPVTSGSDPSSWDPIGIDRIPN
jgi:hypothetical protein